MKAIYIKPETKIVKVMTEYHLLAGSDIAAGEEYKEDDVVLSRRGGSIWDDEDEEY